MRASIVIPTFNEGRRLARTLEACIAECADAGLEIIVVDDCSTDDSAARVTQSKHSPLRVVRQSDRLGPAACRDRGASQARGDALVFLDAHCKPAPGAIEALVSAVEQAGERAIVTPSIATLDAARWKYNRMRLGHGLCVDLQTLNGHWIGLDQMPLAGRFHRSPAIAGCCFAMTRAAYQELNGFDVHLKTTASSVIDLSLRAWLQGLEILHAPEPVVGHWFQLRLAYPVTEAEHVADGLRIGRKILSEPLWPEWRARFATLHAEEVWADALQIFDDGQSSLETGREQFVRNQKRDEHWYAKAFALAWPGSGSSHPTDLQQPSLLDDVSRGTWINRVGECANNRRLVDASVAASAVAENGQHVTFYLKLAREQFGTVRITKAGFECQGAPETAAFADFISGLIEGMPTQRARQLDDLDISKGADLRNCAEASRALVMKALSSTLDQI